jgi:hypothetical protein
MSVICKIHAQLIDNVTALGGEIKRLISLDNQKVQGDGAFIHDVPGIMLNDARSSFFRQKTLLR